MAPFVLLCVGLVNEKALSPPSAVVSLVMLPDKAPENVVAVNVPVLGVHLRLADPEIS